LIYRAEPYTLISGNLYKKGKDEIPRRCINPSEVPLILKGCHDDCCGGHFAGYVTVQKALQSGYWWPTLFKNAALYAKKCDPCQRVGKPIPSSAMPLHPILAQVPFEKWGIDFVGPIKPLSRNGCKRYILVAIEYVTKWAEAIATKNDDVDIVVRFLYENIITRFGCPKELVSDRGTQHLTIPVLMGKRKRQMAYYAKLSLKLSKDPIRIGIKEFLMLCGHIELLTKLLQKVHFSNLFMGKRLFYLLN
jgi:hypothetical protein